MWKNYKTTIVFLFAVTLFTMLRGESKGTENSADFYVSPLGRDCWSGTLNAPNTDMNDGPFKTIERARDAVRGRLAETNQDIVVMLRGGTYFLDKAIVFGLADSGRCHNKVIYRNYPDEEPILTSGVSITGWKKLTTVLPDLPAKAQGKIWAAEVPKELGRFLTLYDGTKSLPRARNEGFVPRKVFKTWDEFAAWNTPENKRTLYFPSGALKTWSNLQDVEIIIRPSVAWVVNILPLESVDKTAGVAETAVPASYTMAKVLWSSEENSAWVENVIDALDEPNEWVLDTAAGKIYLWPQGKQPSNGIVAPKLTELVRIEGNIDYEGPTDEPVRNLVFRGLTFTHGDRYSWEKNHIGRGLQHDWEMFDRSSALLRMRGAQACVIDSCRFTNAGGTGIRLDLYCQDNRITNNQIDHLGGVGVLLAGYGPGTKDVNKNNQIVNNHIHHIGLMYWHSPGVFVWQSGKNRIANNLVHHTSYTAIVVSGRIGWDPNGRSECSKTIRWHEVGATAGKLDWKGSQCFLHGRYNIIERNEIHHVMEKLGDGNCIYVSGTGVGNIVRHNYLHNNTSKDMCAAIRCDDHQDETTIEGNIIHRIGGMGNGIATKGANHIINNIIADLRTETQHRGYISLEVSSARNAIVQRNILYSKDKDQIICGEASYYAGGPPPRLRECKADYNLYYNTEDPAWGDTHLKRERQFGIEVHSISADPMFADIDNGDFRLEPNSPALALGFQQIDATKIGLTKDFRKRFRKDI